MVGFGVGFQARPVEYFNALISILWIVAVINAVNLMDNMDGLAPGVALVGGAFLTYQLANSLRPETAPLAAALSGALGGFLVASPAASSWGMPRPFGGAALGG